MSGSHVFGGLVLGVLLGAGALYVAEQTVLAPEPCAGACGTGTICEGERCVVEVVEAPELEAPVDEAAGKKKRGRRGKRGRGKSSGSADAGEGLAGPPIDNDAGIPRFDANADQTISMSDGSGRLSDAQIDRELAKLDSSFQRCVLDANARVAELGKGQVRFKFGVDGKGKVTGVNVNAPSNLSEAGIVPCVRKAVYGHKFPAFDGPVMKVSSSFSVD
ncbi:hypothetical protein G6O69_26185 [Pseudenhygromyxa sp. WMMC2535]|uniref:hypothetical protein n=1 Tax=Pseudenhygromyxa sp. WMMC2535 TaxID=2712867 RepID=UPI001555E9E4|nr:hypothetical protein [Pseudenhygromyxa sp. WMMC2535]NVB41354.1 hypothetical protein [Pseudenhygromyxa sp. WMMC2535]